MARLSPYETGELTDSIFLILLTTMNPVHGYRMMQEITDMTNGEVEIGPATMYTTLKKLKEVGWVRAVDDMDGKILYEITEEGQTILKKNMTYRKRLVEAAEHWMGGAENEKI